MNKFTVIINTYPRVDREEDLKRCLFSIFKQEYKALDILIIENNDNSTDVKMLIKSLGKTPYIIKVINDPKKRLSYLFNLGWKNVKSEYLAYIADDATADKKWLKNINAELEKDNSIGVVTGPVISTCYPAGEMHRLYLISQGNLLLKILAWPYLHFAMEDQVLRPGILFESGAYSIGAGLEDSKKYKKQEIDLATTTSMGIRKSIIEKIGGFDERFNFNHADGDLFIRIKKAGYKIIFTPKVIAHHYVRLGPSRNAYFIGKDTGIFYRKHIRPKSFNGFIGALLNIMVLNLFWIFSAIRDKNTRQLIGIKGFFEGVIGSSV